MKALALAAAAAFALLAAGCGGAVGTGAPADGSGEIVRPAPQIEAVDEPLPPALRDEASDWDETPEDDASGDEEQQPQDADEDESATGESDAITLCESSGSNSCEPSPAELEKIRAQEEAAIAEIRPDPDSPPRLVARLKQPGGDLGLAAWRGGTGKLCTLLASLAEDGSGGPLGGPCVPFQRCEELCLDSAGGFGQDYEFGGTVSSDADALRIRVADGTTYRYPLTGPLVPGFDRRVFMLHLGSSDWRRLQLLKGDEVVADRKMSGWRVATEECADRYVAPTPGQPTPSEESLRSYEECTKKANDANHVVITIDKAG